MDCATHFIAEQPRQSNVFDELEAKITELWGHLNAATYRFLMLVAEFDRERAYGRFLAFVPAIAAGLEL